MSNSCLSNELPMLSYSTDAISSQTLLGRFQFWEEVLPALRSEATCSTRPRPASSPPTRPRPSASCGWAPADPPPLPESCGKGLEAVETSSLFDWSRIPTFGRWEDCARASAQVWSLQRISRFLYLKWEGYHTFLQHWRLTAVRLWWKNRFSLIEEIKVVRVSLCQQLHDVLAVPGREVCSQCNFFPTLPTALRPITQFLLLLQSGTCPVTAVLCWFRPQRLLVVCELRLRVFLPSLCTLTTAIHPRFWSLPWLFLCQV